MASRTIRYMICNSTQKRDRSAFKFFYLVRLTVICEGVFVDTKVDAAQADTLAEQQAFGVAYAKGILNTLDIPYDEPEEDPEEPEQPAEEPAKEHCDSLIAKGVEISETMFDDPITRGEALALLDQIVK